MTYVLGFAVTSLGFLVLGLAVLARGWRQPTARLLALAALVHGAWALTSILPGMPSVVSGSLQTAHIVGWILFLTGLTSQPAGRPPVLAWIASGVMLGMQITAILVWDGGVARAQALLLVNLTAVILAFAAAVGAFQAAGESLRWSLKFLCFPLAALFAYDMFLFTQLLAVGPLEPGFLVLRAVMNAAVLPLLIFGVIRTGIWRSDVAVSRQATIYSLTFIGIGIYLMLVAAAAMVLPYLSAAPTGPFQLALLFAAILALMFLLSSGRARAKIKLFVGRHFYSRKYDYAHEWRRFMHTLSRDTEASPLENRIIRACADLLEVPGGALWLFDRERAALQATWNFRPAPAGAATLQPERFLDQDGQPQCLYAGRLDQTPLAGEPQVWMVAPLPHGGEIIGFLILSPPRAHHELDHQDEDLLLLVARQCASFLAESRHVQSLQEAKQFARFNRQYAFVAHDIKNIISQLSVMLRNFDKHADDPEFQRDIHSTIRNTVDRLQSTVGRVTGLEEGKEGGGANERTRLYDVVSRELSDGRSDAGDIAVDADDRAREIMVAAPAERLGTIFGHLLSNAREASGDDGRVSVVLAANGRYATLDVIDDGPGMTQEFIDTDLFRPFHSTKVNGFGVGAYQCREFARECGGDLEVVSSPGSGTTMRLRLPVAAQDSQKQPSDTPENGAQKDK